MLNRLKDILFDKQILILGFGKEGISTYRTVRAVLPDANLSIADQDESVSLQSVKTDPHVNLILGKDYLKQAGKYNYIIKSPGVPLNGNVLHDYKGIITSQTEIFMELYASQVIGVTGTKGKSTTASLIYHIIKGSHENTCLIGNIGIPPFDMLPELNDMSRIIFELSSHQLERCKVSPNIAVLLNLFSEHLDHYEDLNKYWFSKMNIARFQNKNDHFIYNSDNPNIDIMLKDIITRGKKYRTSLKYKTNPGCYLNDGFVFFDNENIIHDFSDVTENRQIKGEHNLSNILAAIIACILAGVSDEIILSHIRTFKALPHRLEFVGNYHGIDFYNDSIATIPEAVIEALKTLKEVDTLILGGFDRGIDYTTLVVFLSKTPVNHIVCTGAAGKRIFEMLTKRNLKTDKLILANNFTDAIKQSIQLTERKKKCLLSPAAASYDEFKNFEERGTKFIELIKAE